MKHYRTIIGGIVGTAAALALVLPLWFGWDIPPWAKAQDVREVRSAMEGLATADELREVTVAIKALAIEVAANTEAGWLRQLENALARKDATEIRRICNIISKLYGYRASGCP